jgi:hypothetical protein
MSNEVFAVSLVDLQLFVLNRGRKIDSPINDIGICLLDMSHI